VPLFNLTFHGNDLCSAHIFQEKALENCIETLVVKLLHATKDASLKVLMQCERSFFGLHWLTTYKVTISSLYVIVIAGCKSGPCLPDKRGYSI
jgi:hypothetical protein